MLKLYAYMRFSCLLALLSTLTCLSGGAWADRNIRSDYVGRMIVKYKEPADQNFHSSVQRSSLQHTRGKLRHSRYKTGNNADIYYLDQPRSATEARRIAKELMQRADIEYIEPDYRRYPAFIPNDSGYAQQWFLKGPANAENGGIKAEQAWEIERGNSDIVIAVIDTGILPHEDIVRVLPGYDFISANSPGDFLTANDGDGRDSNPTDPGDAVAADECNPGDPENNEDSSWHGTLVSGLLIAETNNTKGIAGLDHRAYVLPLRALGKCGGSSSDIADAIRWAAGLTVPGVPNNPNPATVINLSLGSQDPCTNTEQAAIDAAVIKGAVVIAAAGNDGEVDTINSPANCNNVIAVAATTRQGAETCYTNVSSLIDLSAPGGNNGESVCSAPLGTGLFLAGNNGTTTARNDAYYSNSGTSFAAPMVSGTAALMKAVDSSLTPTSIETILKNTARVFPTGTNDGFGNCTTSRCGAGILDVEGAVRAASNGGLDTVPNPFSFEDRNNVNRSAVITSNSVAITGIDTPAPISISAGQGEYSIDGGAFTRANGSINAGQTVTMRLTAPSAYEASAGGTLTIGGVSDNFAVTTKKKPSESGGGSGGGEAGWLLPLCLGPLGGALRRNRLKQKRPESL